MRLCRGPPVGRVSLRSRIGDKPPVGRVSIQSRIGDKHPAGHFARIGALRLTKSQAKRIGASRLTKSNANTFVRARAYGLFQPRVSGSTSCVGTIPRCLRPLGWSLHTRLIPPHSVGISPYALASLKYYHNTGFRPSYSSLSYIGVGGALRSLTCLGDVNMHPAPHLRHASCCLHKGVWCKL